jgi:hypothetical protein
VSISSSTSRKLSGKRWYSHTQWAMTSAGNRNPRYDTGIASTNNPTPTINNTEIIPRSNSPQPS